MDYQFKLKENQDMNLPDGIQSGIMSKDLKTNFPNLVKEIIPVDLDGKEEKEKAFEAVNYTGLIPPIIKAIQEQNENFKTENKALKAELDSLKRDFDEIKSLLKRALDKE